VVLADTSVWIDFLRSPEALTTRTLSSLIKDRNQVVICGIVIQEVLQGIRAGKSYELVQERLLKFPFIPTNRDTWIGAAALYRKLRAKGFTLPSWDVTLASIAIQNDLAVLTRDAHFKTIASNSALKLYVG
jgi:hypothetical protein